MSWYSSKTRKPRLRIKILEILALEGNLSKRQIEFYLKNEAAVLNKRTRSHYKEISDAFNNLLDKHLIEPRGKLDKHKLFGLTISGLEALINESQSIDESWLKCVGYIQHIQKAFAPQSLNNIYSVIMKKYAPFQCVEDYSNILNVFLVMSKRFVQEISKEDNLALELLRILSKAGGMTLEKLSSKMPTDLSTIKITLEKLTLDSHSYTQVFDYTDDVDPENQRIRFADFLQHCLVFHSIKDEQDYYELSLFGIIFLLKSVRTKDSNPFNATRDYQWEKNIDDIASWCTHKLPLVFGKWSFLSKYLKLWRFYNFDSVLFSNQEVEAEPLVIGGNKEIGESIYSMYVLNNKARHKVVWTGIQKLEQAMTKVHSESDRDINRFIDYLRFKAKFLNPEMAIDDIFEELKKDDIVKSSHFSWGQDKFLPIKLLEKSFEAEITLLYFINLMNSWYEPVASGELASAMLKGDFEFQKKYPQENIKPMSPQNKLKLMLSNDDEIRQVITQLRDDMVKYFEDLSDKINGLYNALFVENNHIK
jgi:hypothetical protein